MVITKVRSLLAVVGLGTLGLALGGCANDTEVKVAGDDALEAQGDPSATITPAPASTSYSAQTPPPDDTMKTPRPPMTVCRHPTPTPLTSVDGEHVTWGELLARLVVNPADGSTTVAALRIDATTPDQDKAAGRSAYTPAYPLGHIKQVIAQYPVVAADSNDHGSYNGVIYYMRPTFFKDATGFYWVPAAQTTAPDTENRRYTDCWVPKDQATGRDTASYAADGSLPGSGYTEANTTTTNVGGTLLENYATRDVWINTKTHPDGSVFHTEKAGPLYAYTFKGAGMNDMHGVERYAPSAGGLYIDDPYHRHFIVYAGSTVAAAKRPNTRPDGTLLSSNLAWRTVAPGSIAN